MAEEKKSDLLRLVSDAGDDLVSELYTDDQIAKRIDDFHQSHEDPTLDEEYSFLIAEARDFSEQLMYRILEKLDDAGYLNKKIN